MYQRGAWCIYEKRPGRHQRAKPEFSRAQRSGADVSGESAHGGGQCGCGLHRGIRAERTTRIGFGIVVELRSTRQAMAAVARQVRHKGQPYGTARRRFLLELSFPYSKLGESYSWPMS